MNDSLLQQKNEMLLFCQQLKGFFKAVGDNREGINTLLRQFRDLRKEYVKLLRDDVIVALLQSKGEGTISNNLSRERLATLLEKLVVSFRADQEKTYRFIEEGLLKDVLQNISHQTFTEGLKELSTLRKEMERVLLEQNSLKKEKDNLQKSVGELTQKSQSLEAEREELHKEIAKLSKQIQDLKGARATEKDQQEDIRKAIEDYQTIVREIRQELEGKKAYDLWRLKVFYNRVASLTHSTWSYPGIPVPPPFSPTSITVRKFLESL